MEENREKNNKKIEDEKRLEQDLRQMADDVILPDSLEPEAIQKMLQARQEEKQQGSKTKKIRCSDYRISSRSDRDNPDTYNSERL